ncbi:Mechanosensitive channel MscK precursor [Pseudoruegeria aquimaris]|uniref:Mechanosensitive channel MscK n=1 Tax=Pseudoruegeria aquimaris TaxID=393663 RepID=A0A1Y5SCA3_9RHOB|nr:mechanosensitive ion channel domain-containing protein [Pseudoruegeria aquimaris]SLN36347.1 Mechanosensitive channel MscK precursor [Pseudoruegeria aquimaris]
MEQELQQLVGEFWRYTEAAESFARSMLLPSRLRQLVILMVLAGVAWGVNAVLAPRVHDWIRSLQGRSKAQLRNLVELHRRIWGYSYVALIWLTVFVMNTVLGMFPSHTYILRIAGSVGVAWIFVSLIARFVRNPLLARILKWGAWAYAALYFTGLLGAVAGLMDAVAIEINDFRLSLLIVFKALVVTGALVFVARSLSNLITRWAERNENISPTLGVLIAKITQAFLYVSAVFFGLRAIGFDLTGLTVLSGAIGLGLGFGLQKIVSNIVSGVIILMDKSVKPGDVISLGDTFGWIDSLGARYVSVVTRDGREYLIPNEDLITNQVVNWSHSNELVRLDIHFGTSYGDDPHLVRQTAIDAALSVGRVLPDKQPVCHITGFGDSSVDYVLRFWIADATSGLTNVRGDVYLALWDAFKAAGISIPFPQREVRLLGEGGPDGGAGAAGAGA